MYRILKKQSALLHTVMYILHSHIFQDFSMRHYNYIHLMCSCIFNFFYKKIGSFLITISENRFNGWCLLFWLY